MTLNTPNKEIPIEIKTVILIIKMDKGTIIQYFNYNWGMNVYFNRSEFVSDFDLMMARKKDERRKRKRKDVDIINDNDDLIAHLIEQMKHASEVTYFQL